MTKRRILFFCFFLLLSVISFGTNTSAKTKNKLVFVVDHNAKIKLYDKPAKENEGEIHYLPFIEISPESCTSGRWLSQKGDDTIYDKVIFDISEGLLKTYSTIYSFRISEQGKITQAGWIRSQDANDENDPEDFHDLSNPEELNNSNRVNYDTSKTLDKVYYDDGILLNAGVDGSSSINLEIGEKFQLEAYRTWQIVNEISGNYFIEPDFHYSVVQGDSVDISNTGLIRAKKKGMSIIRVTYDQLDVGYLGSPVRYNAIDPVCTGIIVVSVGENNSTSLNTGITLTEFDTVYYSRKITSVTGITKDTNETYAEYSFVPDKGVKVKVLPAPELNEAISGDWTSVWTIYEPDNTGKYTVKLNDGKNIICVEKGGMVKYHVVKASGLDITINNKSSANQELSVGDTAEIHLDNLYFPVPKMAAVYNPGSFSYSGTVFPYIQYDLDGSTFKGSGGQYNLRNSNRIDVQVDEAGELILKNGCVNEPYMGSPGITHHNIPGNGLTRNFNAVTISKTYSILPDIILNVYDNSSLSDEKRNKVEKIISPVAKSIGIIPVAPNYIRTSFGDDTGSRDFSSNYIYGEELDQSSMVNGGVRRSFSLKGYNLDNNSTALFRYWKDGSTDYYIERSKDSTFTFSGELLKVPEDQFENVELIIIPNDSNYEPFTYAFKVFSSNSIFDTANVLPYFLDIKPLFTKDEGYDDNDGRLKPENILYQNNDGTEIIDLGYGFLATENRYSMTLPESVSEMAFDLVWFRQSKGGDNSYTKAEITIEGKESYLQECKGPDTFCNNSVITQPIPLNDSQDTIIHIKLTTTEKRKEHLQSEYIIKVQKHSNILRKRVSFNFETEGTSLLLKNSNNRQVKPSTDGFYFLTDGEYNYTASCAGYRSLNGSFTVDTSVEGDQTIEIPTLEGPRKVEFTSPTSGIDVTVKDAKNKTVTPEEGVFPLIGGETYTYIASAEGYLAVKDTFTVGDEPEQVVEIPALHEAPDLGRGKSVSVSIVSDEKKILNQVSVPMNLSSDEMDLVTGKNYVEYNLGTFTALHALIYALDDDQGVDYTCRKGKLKVITDMAGTYKNGSWVCEVNGIPVSEPSLYPVKADDHILLYYNKGYEGMTHALFKEPMYEITEGEDVTLTLYGHEVGKDTDESVIADASIYVNQKEVGTTDASGSITLSGLTMSGSPYVVTAKKNNGDGQNILTYNQCMVSVQSKTESISGSQTVRFRLIGDSKHGDSGHERYQTWIATEEIPLTSGFNTVYDIFMKAITCAGLKQDGAQAGYVRMIQAPASLGGHELRELDNGSSSGWMYTLNGIHVQKGVLEQPVKAGDVIVFHYVDNFHIEENNYTWLEATDENPKDVHPYLIQNVMNLITDLPAASKLTLKDKQNVEVARKAYNGLTYDQKKQVDSIDSSALKKLTDAEGKIAELQKAATTAKKTTTTPAVKVGKVGTVGNLKYKVVSVKAKSRAVTVTGMKNKKKTSVIIPATIKINKVSYKVTAIANNAFKGNKKLKIVTIGANVKSIGKNGFANCKNLKKIIVKTKVLKKVGAKSLKGIHKKAVIKVPPKKLKAYRKMFNNKGQTKLVKVVK